MGPDEEKDYNSAMLMHYNDDTGKWEEVGKIKDVKKIIETPDVDGDISDILKNINGRKEYNMSFDIGMNKRRYTIYELNLAYKMPGAQVVYEISERHPFGLGNFLSKKSAIDRIASVYGAVISMSSERLRDAIANEGESVKNVMKMLRNFTPGYIPKIVGAFEVLDSKFNKVVLIIRVR